MWVPNQMLTKPVIISIVSLSSALPCWEKWLNYQVCCKLVISDGSRKQGAEE